MSTAADDPRITRSRLIRQATPNPLKAWINRSRDRRRIIPEHRPSTVVEQLEPRYLLSADLLALPPQDQQTSILKVGTAAAPGDAGINVGAGDLRSTQKANEVVFVDPAVEEAGSLIDQIIAGAGDDRRLEIVQLDGSDDGITQISDWLEYRRDLAAIHVIAHGDSARVELGTATLDTAALGEREAHIAGWSAALTDTADLFIVGCDVAEDAEGRAFVDRLAELTRADVAASGTPLGNELLGGNWALEYQVGTLEAASLVAGHPSYGFLLAAGADAAEAAAVELDTQAKLDELAAALANADAAIDAALGDEQLNQPIEGLPTAANTVNELLGLEVDADNDGTAESVADLADTLRTYVQLEKLLAELSADVGTSDPLINGFSRVGEKIVLDLAGTPDEVDKTGYYLVFGDGTGGQPTATGKAGSSAGQLSFDFAGLRSSLIGASATDLRFVNATTDLDFGVGTIRVAAASAEVARTDISIRPERLDAGEPMPIGNAVLRSPSTPGGVEQYVLDYVGGATLGELATAINAHGDFVAQVVSGSAGTAVLAPVNTTLGAGTGTTVSVGDGQTITVDSADTDDIALTFTESATGTLSVVDRRTEDPSVQSLTVTYARGSSTVADLATALDGITDITVTAPGEPLASRVLGHANTPTGGSGWSAAAIALDISRDIENYSLTAGELRLDNLAAAIETSSGLYQRLASVDQTATAATLGVVAFKGEASGHAAGVYGLQLSMDATVTHSGLGLLLLGAGEAAARSLTGNALLRFDLEMGLDTTAPASSAFLRTLRDGADSEDWLAGFVSVSDGAGTFALDSRVALDLYDTDDLDATGRVFDTEFVAADPWQRSNVARVSGSLGSGGAVRLNADLDDGTLNYAYYRDTAIEADASDWRALFAQMSSVGEQIDVSAELGIELPMVGVSLYELLKPSDGRSVGDVFSFSYYDNGTTRTNVLEDVLARPGTASYSDLMAAIGDYLAGRGDYADLDALLSVDFLDSPYVIRGGEQTGGTVDFGASLNLASLRSEAVAFDDRLQSIGFAWNEGEGLPITGRMQVRMDHADVTTAGVSGLTASNALIAGMNYTDLDGTPPGGSGVDSGFSFSADVDRSAFNANGLIGAVPVLMKGDLQFDTGTVIAEVDKANGLLAFLGLGVSSLDLNFVQADPAITAYADFDLTGELFGTRLSTLGGGTPNVVLDWRSGGSAVPWSQLHSAPLSYQFNNLSSLSALGALPAGELLAMTKAFGNYLLELRDSGEFDGVLPFTDLPIGGTLDFSDGFFELIDEQLQTVEQSIFASAVISPVLKGDLAFDIQFQRPGDPQLQMVTVVIEAVDTQNFSHIDQLAALIDQRIASAVNAVLGYQRYEGGRWVDVGAELEVTRRVEGGSPWATAAI